MRRTVLLMLMIGASCLLAASDKVTKTERADLPAGGTVVFRNSTGELTIEGWDQPGVEITTIESAPGAKVSTALEGNDLVIATEFPKRKRLDLEYLVKVPRNAKLVVEHHAGEIHFDDVAGDIHATLIQGQITLRLPEGQYGIDAKSRIGDVISDFPGARKRQHLGHAFLQDAQAAHSLYLRNGFGDILILREHTGVASK